MNKRRFAAYAWGVLFYNLAVILWGAYVRASGSGAGCGSHWPLCNGNIIPRAEYIETMVEFTHRATSGVALLLVLGMAIWARMAFPARHQVRFGADMSLLFVISEALVGAGLVLLGLVADNSSVLRAVVISIHLVNTFFLVAGLTLTAWWASGGAPVSLRGHGLTGGLLAVALMGSLLLGVTGAITALGDTLFPVGSVAEGIERDFSTTAHFLERLRIIHPLLAVMLGLYIAVASNVVGRLRPSRLTQRFARWLVALFVIQLLVGLLNVRLLAPIWLQLVHLLLADGVWIMLVLLSATALAVPVAEQQAVQRGQPLPRSSQSA